MKNSKFVAWKSRDARELYTHSIRNWISELSEKLLVSTQLLTHSLQRARASELFSIHFDELNAGKWRQAFIVRLQFTVNIPMNFPPKRNPIHSSLMKFTFFHIRVQHVYELWLEYVCNQSIIFLHRSILSMFYFLFCMKSSSFHAIISIIGLSLNAKLTSDCTDFDRSYSFNWIGSIDFKTLFISLYRWAQFVNWTIEAAH